MGYESVVIVTSQDSHTEMGSEKGRRFIENFDLVVEFLSYQQGQVMQRLLTSWMRGRGGLVVNTSYF